ncbi:hypothetical protein BKA65DRAFT_192364 [Rhexocercosporidium sp. MPI-PUGE-AT-0058]|nr:hypothetical protein BKA65DRAFT_192364 [Rhexocercosporidium sp. MPI-PUGE-AT-0058]
MAELNLPFEVKRLIYDHVDLPTLKSLRLVSQDWAVVGIDLLLLPTFIVKSSAFDIPRLISLGNHPALARQAASTIRTINFWSNDWDVVYLRSIFCSRHVHLRNYEAVAFVPTRDEQEALEELDALIQQRNLESEQGESIEVLTKALKSVPRLQKLHITCPNQFSHPMLRKVWEEYNLETYRQDLRYIGPARLLNIFSAAQAAELSITKFQHDQFNSNFLCEDGDTNIPWRFPRHVNALRSLSLNINDVLNCNLSLKFAFDGESNAEDNWSRTPWTKNLMSVPDILESLSITCEALDRLRLDFLQTPAPNLHTLSLVGTSISAPDFLTFLTSRAPSLRRLHLGSVELRISHPPNSTYDWQNFLSDLRDSIGHGSQNQSQSQKQARTPLQKFQLSGVIKSPLPNGPTWMMWPMYRSSEEEWDAMPVRKASEKAKEMERFVVEGGEWPMGAEDDISSMMVS